MVFRKGTLCVHTKGQLASHVFFFHHFSGQSSDSDLNLCLEPVLLALRVTIVKTPLFKGLDSRKRLKNCKAQMQTNIQMNRT